MRSLKYRPKPGSARISERSAAGRPVTSSTTSGTPSVNIRVELRLSASVSVMAPTCRCARSRAPACAGTRRHSSPGPDGGREPTALRWVGSALVPLAGVGSGRLQDLVGPEVVGVARGGREVVAPAVVGAGEVLP